MGSARVLVLARQLALLLPAAALVAAAVPAAAAAEPAWTWPLADEPTVARQFDPPQVRYGAGHRGADLAGAAGAAVLASGSGRISYAGLLAGRGVVVVVHGELRTTYEPVRAEVAVGQQVAVGQRLGVLEAGHAGCPVPACLHWGLRRGDTYLDPVALVERGPVRLLPLAPAARPELATPVELAAPPPAAPPPAAAPPESRPAPLRPAAPAGTSWSLRAAEAPLGAAALVALLAGLGLLMRPRRPPDGPAGADVGAAAGRGSEVCSPPQAAAVATPIDLPLERARRRTAS